VKSKIVIKKIPDHVTKKARKGDCLNGLNAKLDKGLRSKKISFVFYLSIFTFTTFKNVNLN